MDEPTTTSEAGAFSPAKDIGTELLTQAHLLMGSNNPRACLDWIEQGDVLRRPEALSALCALITPPTSFLQRLRGRRKEWSPVRIAAIKALRILGDPAGLLALTRTLLYDPDAEVRFEASRAVRAFGSHATPHLLLLLQEADNWPTDGMLALIRMLGELGDKNAGPSLVRVLTNQFPRSSRRETRHPLMSAALFSLLLWAAGALLSGQDGFLEALVANIPIYLSLLFFTYTLFFLPSHYSQKRKLRRRLHIAAAEALCALKDKKALPSVIEATFYHLDGEALKAARRTLFILLGLVGPEDAGLIPPPAERYLLSRLNLNQPEFTLRIVQALEFIGTGQAVRPVSRLARHHPGFAASDAHMKIRAEAERILPFLEERRHQEQQAGFLLRASASPSAPTEALLRPSQERLETPAEQLLRPTQGSSE